jgi:lambda family phage portal protein
MRMKPVKPNTIDRIVNYFSPVKAARRQKARMALAFSGGYTGASKTRRSLKEWMPDGYDADSDILPDLPTLRDRSRDMVRNMPLAAGAINTKVTNVVGTGLRLQSRIDRAMLNMTEEQADAWEINTEREFKLWWDSFDCDAARTLKGDGITALVYRQAKENGDVLVLLPRIPRQKTPYTLAMQLVEADRVSNPDYTADTDTLACGVQKDKYGAPMAYHVMEQHPGKIYGKIGAKWRKIPAYGPKTGLKNIIHVYRPTRPGQTRGVPDLAAVIEPLKQLTRYAEAELMAAVVSAMFTVFVETESGDPTFDLTDMSAETGSTASDDDYKLGNGAIIGLAPGEKVHDSNPNRPNTAFDPFTLAILRQIGTALELPFEILVKHFTASYSAARAALLEAWKYFMSERKWLVDHFNSVIYEIWMHEAVALGRIAAPGFLTDPAMRQAYLGAMWVGPAKGQIDELKEIKAARERVDMGVSTLSEVTAEMTGGDWEKKHPQSVKEHNARKDAGLITDMNELSADVIEESS